METAIELDVEVGDEQPVVEIGDVVVEVLLPPDWGVCWWVDGVLRVTGGRLEVG